MTLENEIDSWEKDIHRLKHCKSKALPKNKERYEDCIDYNKQYIKWLRELMAYRIAFKKIKEAPQLWAYGVGAEKCIQIIEEELDTNNMVPEMKCEED